MKTSRLLWLLACILLAACGQQADNNQTQTNDAPADDAAVNAAAADDEAQQTAGRRFDGAAFPIPPHTAIANPTSNASRSAYFGDLHVHTRYSFDAFAFGTIATPDDAYRYAKGAPLTHPGGFDVQLSQPLDFYAVTDHAMFLGAVPAAADTTHPFSKHAQNADIHNLNDPGNLNIESIPQRVTTFSTFLTNTVASVTGGDINLSQLNNIAIDAWADIIRAAEEHNNPGTFTTFVAYEYTSSTDDRGNLHRNVVFNTADKLPLMPFSRFHSQDPEGLWDWLDGLRNQGIEALAIPHNANGSNGQMFKMVDWAGDPLDEDYTAKRIRNEPIIEITQVKGTSETHPALSDTDEWAGFEIMPYRVATTLASEPKGSYARDALKSGLLLAEQGITNPYQFGFVAASDTHTGAAYVEEDKYFSKVGLLDGTGSQRGSIPLSPGDAEIIQAAGRVQIEQIDGKPYVQGAYETWGASGLAGVWAEENTREAIYRAFRRKETFATSGPRIKARLFAGYNFDASMTENAEGIARAYAVGVSMGSELYRNADNAAPSFLVQASRDANSAPLQRLQIIKGWLENGEAREQVYDVACSDGGAVDPETHRCPDNGATVEITTCAYSADKGAAELNTVWQDPAFNPEQRAFYYARVLENPTCRWSTWDAIRAGVQPRADLAKTIQERAWTSPVWYIP